MISQRQLQQWRKQSLKDIEEYKKDEKNLNQLYGGSKPQLRTNFQKLRARYFNLQSQENDKLSRLLIQIQQQMEQYPEVIKTYLTYNASSILILATCLLAPKKIISKIILSLVTYGLKKNIGDGIFTYYMIEKMALSNRMTEKEQELRNVLEFYYMHRFFTKSLVSEEEKKQASQIIEKMQKLNETYNKYKKVEQLL